MQSVVRQLDTRFDLATRTVEVCLSDPPWNSSGEDSNQRRSQQIDHSEQEQWGLPVHWIEEGGSKKAYEAPKIGIYRKTTTVLGFHEAFMIDLFFYFIRPSLPADDHGAFPSHMLPTSQLRHIPSRTKQLHDLT